VSDRSSAVCAAAAFALLSGLLTALPSEAQEDLELPEFLTPEEQAERELERKRNAQPLLACEPSALKASAVEGGAVSLKLTVRNAGGQVLEWSVASSAKWLGVQPRSGRLGFEEKTELTVGVSAVGLEVGTHSGEIALEAAGAGGSPKHVTVSVAVRAKSKQVVPPAKPAKPVEKPSPPGPRKQTESPRTLKRDHSPGQAKRGRLGVRAAYHMESVGEVRDSAGGALVGIYYRRGRFSESKFLYEFGLDASTRDESGGFATQPFGGRADLLFRLGGSGDGKAVRMYLASGLAGFVEQVEDLGTGESYTNYAAALSLGGGVGLLDERLDLRLLHDLFLGSDNLQGKTMVAVSYAF
jgi:hypothetical protein